MTTSSAPTHPPTWWTTTQPCIASTTSKDPRNTTSNPITTAGYTKPMCLHHHIPTSRAPTYQATNKMTWYHIIPVQHYKTIIQHWPATTTSKDPHNTTSNQTNKVASNLPTNPGHRTKYSLGRRWVATFRMIFYQINHQLTCRTTTPHYKMIIINKGPLNTIIILIITMDLIVLNNQDLYSTRTAATTTRHRLKWWMWTAL